jgi:23S rRNA pseudouridine1911/1915/1917 synthase
LLFEAVVAREDVVGRGSAPAARPKIVATIAPAWAHWKLVDVVSMVAELDRVAARALIERGAAWLDQHRRQDPAHPVLAGQQITVHFAPPDARRAVVLPGDILYEDQTLLVLNKPPGVYVTMTPWDATRDLLWAAREYLIVRDGSVPNLHLAHRLDRDTSGVLVVSKAPAANAPLQELFLGRAVEKRYLAIVGGSPPEDHFELHTGHGRGAHGLFRVYPRESIGVHLPYGHNVVKAMETQFQVLERFDAASLLEARPATGRTHQIRLHLAHLGYPIMGDSRYGGAMELAGVGLSHHLLHAAVLRFPHPITRAVLHFEAPLSPLFSTVLETLRRNTTYATEAPSPGES